MPVREPPAYQRKRARISHLSAADQLNTPGLRQRISDGYRNIGMYSLRSFSAHNVRTENRHIIATFATLDRAPIGTYGAPLESFGCPVQKRGVIIGRPISSAGKSLGDALAWDAVGATQQEALARGPRPIKWPAVAVERRLILTNRTRRTGGSPATSSGGSRRVALRSERRSSSPPVGSSGRSSIQSTARSRSAVSSARSSPRARPGRASPRAKGRSRRCERQ